MSIIVLVAGQAIPLQLHIEDRLDMTGGALGFAVRADQRVAGVFAVVKAHFRPAAAGVAGFASFAEVTFVIVVLEMAGNTGHIEFIGERVLAVAAGAFLFGVLAVQYEIRVAVVIETGVVPAFWIVTGAAFVAATAVMRIVLGMTVIAIRRRVLKCVVLMAVQAGGFLVLAYKRITG